MGRDTKPVTGGTPYKVKIVAHNRPQLRDQCFHRDRGRWRAVYGTVRGAYEKVNLRPKKAIKPINPIKGMRQIEHKHENQALAAV